MDEINSQVHLLRTTSIAMILDKFSEDLL